MRVSAAYAFVDDENRRKKLNAVIVVRADFLAVVIALFNFFAVGCDRVVVLWWTKVFCFGSERCLHYEWRVEGL